MDNLIKMLTNLSIEAEPSEIDLLCDKINSIKITEGKEEVIEELIKKELFNFFEILAKKGRCFTTQEVKFIKWLY